MKLDETRCRKMVSDHTGFYFFQCERTAGYGPNGHYCKRHAVKMNRLAREQEAEERSSSGEVRS